MAELSTVELAEKQRHLNLLVKIKDGKSLSSTELKELHGYEENMTKKKKVKKQIKRKKPDKKKLSVMRIKQIAFDAEDLIHAKAECPGLAAALKKKPDVQHGKEAVFCENWQSWPAGRQL